MTETSKENNKTLLNLNDKLFERMNDRGVIASYLTSSLSKFVNPEQTSQFELVKDPQSNRFNGLLIKKNNTSYSLKQFVDIPRYR